MPKGNRRPRRLSFEISSQLAFNKPLLLQARMTGRMTITIEWDRHVSHERSVNQFAQMDKAIRYKLDRLDQLDQEVKVSFPRLSGHYLKGG
jgi:hypothetical protein